MDVVLIALTLVSLVAATGFGLATWRTLGEERRRSAARVAALASTLDGDAPQPAAAAQPVPVSALFTTESGGSLKTRPLIKFAVVGAMLVVMGIYVAVSSRGAEATSDAVAAPQAAASHVSEGAPLELLSMRHAREGATLTVSGLVRNPKNGAVTTRVAAVVFAFDRDGNFLASGRAPLDFTTLAPGDESPFVVSIPNVTNVGRYRVSFRTEAGMLRHVDRRDGQLRLATARRPEA